MSSIIMLIQSSWSVVLPYRIAGLVTQYSAVIPNSAILGGAGSTLAVGAWLNSSMAEASIIGSPVTTCDDGYINTGGACTKKEEAPIQVSCSDGNYTPQTVYDVNIGFPSAACVKSTNVKSLVRCSAGEESGGVHDQQCRKISTKENNATCPAGQIEITANQCAGSWYFPTSASSYVCPPACDANYDFPYAGAPCPSEYDPLALSLNERKITCTAEAVARGYNCTEGSVVVLEYPDMQPSMPSPFYLPTATTPLRCISKDYEPQIRRCPIPNRFTASPSTTIWETPSGIDTQNPAYFDSVTGLATTCIRNLLKNPTQSCPVGQVYDPTVYGCIDTNATNCTAGSYENGLCVNPDGSIAVNPDGSIACPGSRIFDTDSGTCVTPLPENPTFTDYYSSGGELGWAIGGMQSKLAPSATIDGDVALDMKLLSPDANKTLQDKLNDPSNPSPMNGVVAVGDHDRSNNTYYDSISDTYANEDETTKAIQQNHAEYTAYDNNPDKPHINNTAEAYLAVQSTINDNRPPPINPDADWLQSSADTVQATQAGTDDFFGACNTNATKQAINKDKLIVTEESCTSPVVTNYNSCQVTREVHEPTLKILEGESHVAVEITAPDTIRLTLGTQVDNALDAGGAPCKKFKFRVAIQMATEVNVKTAIFKEAYYDDLFVVKTGAGEIFRKGPPAWSAPGSWPAPGESCEQNQSIYWAGNQDVTTVFKNDLADDSIIEFEINIGVGGNGEGKAMVDIKFDQDIKTEWTDKLLYQPSDCKAKIDSGECSVDGWRNTQVRPPQTIGMEYWVEWDSVNNWNITNNGYDANSVDNLTQTTVYGSTNDIGHLWFRGHVEVRDADDDTFGFIFGYPTEPVWNKDPTSSSYVEGAEDTDSNHYYMLLWTGNNGSAHNYQGIKLYKLYVDYLTLDISWGTNHTSGKTWGNIYHGANYRDAAGNIIYDSAGNLIPIIQELAFVNQKYNSHQRYVLEFEHNKWGGIKFSVDDEKKIDIPYSVMKFKTGRFGFITHSIANVYFTAMEKVLPYQWGKLHPDDTEPSVALKGAAINMRCDLGAPTSILTPQGVKSLEDIRNQPNECTRLDDRTDCSWVSRECDEGYTLPDGSCILERSTYECVDDSYAWESVPLDSTCDFLTCSDGDPNCNVRSDQEVNTDFKDVVVQTAVITEMKHNVNCTDPKDPNTCTVFDGEVRQCSYDQFGMINCCDEFTGKTLDLFKLAMNMMTVASFADEQLEISEGMSEMAFGTGNGDGWIPDDLIDLGNDFTEGANNLFSWGEDIDTGSMNAWQGANGGNVNRYSTPNETSAGTSAESPVDANGASTGDLFKDWFVDAVKGKVKDQLVKLAMEKIVELMSDELKKAIINAVSGQAVQQAASQAGQQAVNAAAQEAMTQAMANLMYYLNLIMVAYAVIQIAIMLYKMFNGCDEEEQDMSQNLKAKQCFYAYTKKCKKVLGICQSKHRERYCCFTTVLSRIIIQQAITQSQIFGGATYTAKQWRDDQGCRGLTIPEVGRTNFDQIDFSEWYNLMIQSGSLPDANSTLDMWTKDKHYANPYGRTDAVNRQSEREVERMNDDYRKKLDKKDVLGEADCNLTPDLTGCKTGIFAD